MMKRVETIEGELSASLFRKFALSGKPVVIRNMFAGQDLEKLDTRERVIEAIGDLELGFQEEYFSRFLKTREFRYGSALQPESLENYIRRSEKQRAVGLVCSQYPTPTRIAELFSPPPICAFQSDGEDIESYLFVAAKGNCAHLHFDADQNHALLYQIFGSKRVILLPADSSRCLCPFFNFSLLNIENLTGKEQRALLGPLGAYEVVLNPRDCLLIPALMWHYAEYLDTCMSMSLRFGRSPVNRIIAETFHTDMFVQNVSAAFMDARISEGRYAEHVARLRDKYEEPAGSQREKYDRMTACFRSMARELAPRSCGPMWWAPPEELIEKQLSIYFERGLYAECIASR